jgi:predicted transcriptional regulator
MMFDKMITNYTKILLIMDDNKIIHKDKYLVPLMQKEIAEILGITKVTVNYTFKEFKLDGLIECEASKYYLTDKAVKIIEKIKEIKENE